MAIETTTRNPGQKTGSGFARYAGWGVCVLALVGGYFVHNRQVRDLKEVQAEELSALRTQYEQQLTSAMSRAEQAEKDLAAHTEKIRELTARRSDLIAQVDRLEERLREAEVDRQVREPVVQKPKPKTKPVVHEEPPEIAKPKVPPPLKPAVPEGVCADIDGKIFQAFRADTSSPTVATTFNWQITFSDGTYRRHYHNVKTEGTYTCEGTRIIGSNFRGDRVKGSYDPKTGILTWEGTEYEAISD